MLNPGYSKLKVTSIYSYEIFWNRIFRSRYTDSPINDIEYNEKNRKDLPAHTVEPVVRESTIGNFRNKFLIQSFFFLFGVFGKIFEPM